jgi:hypothetical protein
VGDEELSTFNPAPKMAFQPVGLVDVMASSVAAALAATAEAKTRCVSTTTDPAEILSATSEASGKCERKRATNPEESKAAMVPAIWNLIVTTVL